MQRQLVIHSYRYPGVTFSREILAYAEPARRFMNQADALQFLRDLALERELITRQQLANMAGVPHSWHPMQELAEALLTQKLRVYPGDYRDGHCEFLKGDGIGQGIAVEIETSLDLPPPVTNPAKSKPAPANEVDEDTDNGPANLNEAMERLEKASEDLAKHGYVPKYSDNKLREMAASNTPPSDRFIVRFSPAPTTKQGEFIAPEDNSGPIGHMRDTGRHPLWMSTFDQIERADTDPEVIANVFGTNYDPNRDYMLYVIDRGEDHQTDGSDVFVPTFENMRAKLKQEFAGTLSPELVDKVMTPEYAEAFRNHWQAFNDDLTENGLHWTKSFNTDVAEDFAAEHFDDPVEQDAFLARQVILSEIGAWEIFTGDGLTERKDQPGRPGAMEILEIQNTPESTADLLKADKIRAIHLPAKKA